MVHETHETLALLKHMTKHMKHLFHVQQWAKWHQGHGHAKCRRISQVVVGVGPSTSIGASPTLVPAPPPRRRTIAMLAWGCCDGRTIEGASKATANIKVAACAHV